MDVEAEEEVDVEEQLRQLTASAESDAADDAVTPGVVRVDWNRV